MKLNITEQQVIKTLALCGDLTPTGIAKESGIHPYKLTIILPEMESKKLIQRVDKVKKTGRVITYYTTKRSGNGRRKEWEG